MIGKYQSKYYKSTIKLLGMLFPPRPISILLLLLLHFGFFFSPLQSNHKNVKWVIARTNFQ